MILNQMLRADYKTLDLYASTKEFRIASDGTETVAVQFIVAADSMAERNSSSSAGLIRKADAPAVVAVERTAGLSFAVSTMTRVAGERLRSRACTSSPLIAGIEMSSTATSGRYACAYRRNACGSRKDWTFQPSDERSRLIAFTTDGSSSTKQMVTACLIVEGLKINLPSSAREVRR
jgi:hypothetical protein